MQYKKNFYQIKSNDEIFERIVKEKETIGYYNLPFADTTEIIEYAKTVKQKDIVVIGIGGSSLGTFAIHDFLMHKENSKKLHFLESTDPIDIKRRVYKFRVRETASMV